MADITAAMVKDLREKSGAGMMDCKKALNETAGDMDAALDWLRTKGLAAAQKKSSRTAAEGLVGVATSGTKGAAVEVNSETDFVAKNDQFQQFVREITQISLATGDDIEALKAESMPSGTTVAEVLTNNIATIGENQSLRRAKRLEVSKGAVVSYVHNAASPGLGKIGVLVALESDASDEVLQGLGKQLAMHIAAAFPKALNEADLDEAEIERADPRGGVVQHAEARTAFRDRADLLRQRGGGGHHAGGDVRADDDERGLRLLEHVEEAVLAPRQGGQRLGAGAEIVARVGQVDLLADHAHRQRRHAPALADAHVQHGRFGARVGADDQDRVRGLDARNGRVEQVRGAPQRRIEPGLRLAAIEVRGAQRAHQLAQGKDLLDAR